MVTATTVNTLARPQYDHLLVSGREEEEEEGSAEEDKASVADADCCPCCCPSMGSPRGSEGSCSISGDEEGKEQVECCECVVCIYARKSESVTSSINTTVF